jgi:hypothetical protein
MILISIQESIFARGISIQDSDDAPLLRTLRLASGTSTVINFFPTPWLYRINIIHISNSVTRAPSVATRFEYCEYLRW